MQIQFLGAAREVTGSCFLVTAGGRRLLPLHVVLPHSRVEAFHAALEALREREAGALEAHRVLLEKAESLGCGDLDNSAIIEAYE